MTSTRVDYEALVYLPRSLVTLHISWDNDPLQVHVSATAVELQLLDIYPELTCLKYFAFMQKRVDTSVDLVRPALISPL